MKVLIADKFQSWGGDALSNCGCEVQHEPALAGDTLRDAVKASGCQILIVRGTKVAADAITAGDSLGLIVRAGAGYNSIDVEAASKHGVFVANCPGKNAIAVAELAFGLILTLDRRIVEGTNDLCSGLWNKAQYAVARGLKGRTLGVIGLGEIGKSVARLARSFEMKVVAWSRSLTPETAASLGVEFCAEPAAVAEACDILSIHLALTSETRGMIGENVLSHLREGSFVINTSRAEVLDYVALHRLAAERQWRVGLDVYPGEPGSGKGEFAPAVMQGKYVACGTHHIGASTDQAQNAIASETVRIVEAYLRTGQVPNCVNLREDESPACCLKVRHINKPGVLARVLNELSQTGINVEEMNNVLLEGDHAACALIHLDAKPSAEVMERIVSGSADVMAASVAG